MHRKLRNKPPAIFFLIPLFTVFANDGTEVPVFYTNDMELWCKSKECELSLGFEFNANIDIDGLSSRRIGHHSAVEDLKAI